MKMVVNDTSCIKVSDTKNIRSIVYNHLNLPTKIVFQNGGDFPSISYLYTATGKKIAKTVDIASRNRILYTVDYLDGYQYESEKLLFFPTAEGYVKYTVGVSNPFDYVFNYTDHLGNIRLSYAVNPSTGIVKKMEENNYYPFGLKHATYNTEAKIIVPRPEPGADTAVSGKYMIQKTDVLAAAMEMPPMELPPGELIASEIYSGYNYKYNGKELQDELGLNVTAMDYRQYDSAIGRFYSPDVLSELAYSISPYRFAYNNPVYFNDPTGLFETRKEAREYRREHHIKGGISKDSDGSFSINDTKNNVSYFKPEAGSNFVVDSEGVTKSALVTVEKKESNSGGTGFGWMTIWGTDRSGSTDGWKGTTTNSLESSDFITPQNSSALNNSTNSLLKFFQWIAGYFSNVSTTAQHSIAIQEAIKKNGNTSTMEVQNTEPVVNASVKIATYHFHLNDSTITKSTNTVNFNGKASDVKRQVDSTNNRNETRNSDKEAWLKSWGK